MMSQPKQQKQSTPVLDLDGLILEPPTIYVGTRAVQLRDLSTEEIAAFIRELQAAGSLPDAQQPIRMWELLADLAEDPAEAREILLDLPIQSLTEIITWVQEASAPTFHVAVEEAIAAIRIGGNDYAIRPLTVRAYRQALEAQELGASGDDVEASMRANLEVIAAMIDGLTADDLWSMPHAQRRALERFLENQLREEASQVAQTNPRRAQRRRKPS